MTTAYVTVPLDGYAVVRIEDVPADVPEIDLQDELRERAEAIFKGNAGSPGVQILANDTRIALFETGGMWDEWDYQIEAGGGA